MTRRVAIVPFALMVIVGAASASGWPSSSLQDFPDSVVAHIPVGGDPHDITGLPDGSYLYIGNETDDHVTVVRTADRTVVARLTCGSAPWVVMSDPAGDKVYVANLNSGSVSVIRTSDNAVVATVPVGASPCLMACRPQGDFVYVANSASSSISVIRTSDNTVVATVGVGNGPRAVACLPDGNYVYTANYTGGDVSVIRTSDNRVVATVPFSGAPHRVCAVGDGSRVYVTDYGGDKVYVIRTSDNVLVDSFMSGPSTVGIAMFPASEYAYVVNSGDNTVSVVQTTADSLITTIPTGHAPWGVTAPAARDFVYTVDRYGQSVTVIGYRRRHDVCPVRILAPTGVVDSGAVVQPRVLVKNFGTSADMFPVTMRIGSGYTSVVQDTLPAGFSDTVSFPDWTAGPVGNLPVTCFTDLTGDENPANDTVSDSVTVVGAPNHDVGAVAIVVPSGTVRAGDTVTPRARIRNFGNRTERFFNVRFRIGTSYNRTANEAQILYPDSTVELAFAPWVVASGNWVVSCSTMLVSDGDRANDKGTSTVQAFEQLLHIEPDQSDRLEAGEGKTYQFYALIDGDTGGVVEVARPSAAAGWSVRLCDATGADDLTDTDADGTPDLGYVAAGESSWFSLEVQTPSGPVGDTASLTHKTFVITGHLANDSMVADTALLNLTLVPGFSVHNFPNPFSDHTTFVIGLPADGEVSLAVYTRAGERVCRVIDRTVKPTGVHLMPWEAVNDRGHDVAPGTYEYVLDFVHQGVTDRIRKRLVVTRE
jgi:YVTN family beta-propeller protein